MAIDTRARRVQHRREPNCAYGTRRSELCLAAGHLAVEPAVVKTALLPCPALEPAWSRIASRALIAHVAIAAGDVEWHHYSGISLTDAHPQTHACNPDLRSSGAEGAERKREPGTRKGPARARVLSAAPQLPVPTSSPFPYLPFPYLQFVGANLPPKFMRFGTRYCRY